MDSLYAFSKHAILLASSPYMAVFLSMDTMLAPAFIATVFANCLCQLPSCFFTRTHVNLRHTIVYRDIKIYHSNIKTLRFPKSCIPHLLCISLCSLGTKQPIASTFFCLTITHWYTNFRSYLNFDKMCNVPGFRSACRI